MKRCHPLHVKFSHNKIKVLVTFPEDEMYAIAGLAEKYAEGCFSQFVHDVTLEWIKANLREEIESAARLVRLREGTRQ